MTEWLKREKQFCDLHTVAEVERWLTDPGHQIRSMFYVIRWDGATPYVSVAPFDRLRTGGRELLEIVLKEHRRRRERPGAEEESETEGSDGTLR